MSKILLTGFNKNQCTRKFYLGQQLKVVPSHYSLYNCLVDMGHEVEQREVSLGEDLSVYDEVIVFIAAPSQLVTTKLYNGLWAISQRPDCIIAVDDWQAADLYKGVMACTSETKLFSEFNLNVNKASIDTLEPYKEQLFNAVNIILKKENRILLSSFSTAHLNNPDNYGKKLIFGTINYPMELIFEYNPNPYHRNRKPGDLHHEGSEDPSYEKDFNFDQSETKITKSNRFNFASLVQSKTKSWLKKQGVDIKNIDTEVCSIDDWDINLYGSKKDSQRRLTEDKMCLVYQEDWACLMPGYSHAGSGWWRARPLQVADAGSIIIGDKKELEVYYGKDFKYLDLKAKDIVNLNSDELKEIAAAQREAIYRIHPLDKKVQQREINQILEAKHD